MSKTIIAVVTMVLAAASTARAVNLIVNGDFESNTAAGDEFNLTNADFNSTVSAATAYGLKEGIDVLTSSTFGVAPQSGGKQR